MSIWFHLISVSHYYHSGFLDGGDRATVLSSSSPSSPAPFDVNNLSPALPALQASIVVTPPTEHPPPADVSTPSPSFLIKNLPAVLFSQVSDLHPLVGPYGDIKKLELLPSTADEQTHVTALVEYASSTQAAEAAHALHGQAYSNTPIRVEFVRGAEGEADGKAGLNPHAAPFVVQAGLPRRTVLASVTPVYPRSSFSRANLAALSKGGLLAVDPQSLSPYGTPLLYVPLSGMRPSSAPTT